MSTAELTRMAVPVSLRVTGTRDAGGAMTISGVAAAFNTRSTGLPFTEVLDAGCFTDTLSRHDQLLLWSHDSSLPLARKSTGSLKLKQTARGLEFEATLPNTTAARDAWELAKSGIVNTCSFGFIEGDSEWRVASDGTEELHQTNVHELREVSLVASPAYGIGTNVEARSTVADRIARATGARPRVTIRDRSAYGPGSQHSWFLDKLLIARESADEPRVLQFGTTISTSTALDRLGDAHEARKRLSTIQTRAGLSDVAGAGGELIAGGTPSYVADAFAVSAKNASVILGLFTHDGTIDSATRDRGTTTTIPKITGSSIAVQDPVGSAISNTDPTTSLLTSNVSTIAGRVLVAGQFFDFSLPEADTVIAAELGAQWAALADNELLNGTNANHRTQGLLTQSGVTTLTYTDGTPTGAKVMAQIAELAAKTATARGKLPDVVLMNPRRWYALAMDNASQRSIVGEPFDEPEGQARPGRVGQLAGGLRVFATPAITATFGGGTEDRVLILTTDDLRVFYNAPIFAVADQTSATTAQIHIVARSYLSAHPGRYPTGTGVLSGTGMIPAAAIS